MSLQGPSQAGPGPGRRRGPAAIALALLAVGTLLYPAQTAARPARQACTLAEAEGAPPASLASLAFVGEPVAFEVRCPEGIEPAIAWEFGDDTPRTAYGPDRRTTHAYAAPGRYTVFARLQGEDIPLTATRTVVHPPTAAAPAHSSTILHDSARGRVWAVNPDHGTVAAVSVRNPRLLLEAAVGRHPRTLALGPQGHIWVACQDDATVHILSGDDGRSLDVLKLPFGSRPYGIAFAPDGKTAYVTLEATGRLARLDPVTRTVTAVLELGPTPRGIAVSHDGRRVLITRHISPTGPAAAPATSDHGEVWEVDGPAFTRVRTFRLEADTARDGATNSRGVPNGLSSITITPDGRHALVPALKANTRKGLALDGTRPDFQTTLRTVLIRIDLLANREDMADRKDVDNRSLASSATLDRFGRHVYLTTQGTNKTPILLAHSLGDFSAVAPPDNSPEALLRGEARELAPIGSILAGGRHGDSLLFVHYFLSREVGVYDVSRAGGDPIGNAVLVRTVDGEVLPPRVHLGKQLFYNAADPRMSKDGYLSCVACHLDGGSDGRVWDFTHKGEGLRRTTDLRGRAGLGHGPVHWSANFDEVQDFEHDLRDAFGGEGFLPTALWQTGTRSQPLGDRKAGLSPELDALAAYVTSLARVPPSPYRAAGGSLTDAARRGREIFRRDEVGCARCHSGAQFTDSRLPSEGEAFTPGPVSVFPGATSYRTSQGLLLHDVGTRGPLSGFRMGDTLPGLDTPTLKGLWTGGPYLHDGSAPTLRHVLEAANPKDRHGRTSGLTPAEKDDLLAYLLQIDDLDDEGQSSIGKPGMAGMAGETLKPSLSVEARNGLLHIHYRLTHARQGAQGRIYTLQGMMLKAFAAPSGAPAGSWIWDGRDGRGRKIGKGLYLVRLEARDGFQATRALVFP